MAGQCARQQVLTETLELDHFRPRFLGVQVQLFIKICPQRSSHCILTIIDPFVQLA